MALGLAVDMKLFDAAANTEGCEIYIRQLAAVTGVDPLLISESWLRRR